MVCTWWFGELCYCSCLPVLPCPDWVLLSYVLQTIFLYPVHIDAAVDALSDANAKQVHLQLAGQSGPEFVRLTTPLEGMQPQRKGGGEAIGGRPVECRSFLWMRARERARDEE